MTVQTTDNKYGVSKWIVDPILGRGTHTNIAAAIASASSGETIFIRPGTYPENLTLKAGVNLTGFECDSSLNGTGNVVIIGNTTFNVAGSVTLSGIQLQTNGTNLLTVSGSAASSISLINCYLNCTNFTGISFTANAGSGIELLDCSGNLGTTGISILNKIGTGFMLIINSLFTNSGNSVTANTISAGQLSCISTSFSNPFTTSGTAFLSLNKTRIDLSGINTICLTVGGSLCQAFYSEFYSGTFPTAITVSTVINEFRNCFVVAANPGPAITGAGIINYSGLEFSSGSTSLVNTTTQVAGTLQGLKTAAPAAGFLGEYLTQTFTQAISNGVIVNQAQITITPGVWSVTGTYEVTASSTVTSINLGISTNTGSFTGVVFGDTGVQLQMSGVIGALTIAPFRVVVSTNTQYFLVQNAFFSGTCNATGRISATRVG